MCHPNGLLFSLKILRLGSSFGQKNLIRVSRFTKNCEKLKISCFKVEKPVEMHPDFAKI